MKNWLLVNGLFILSQLVAAAALYAVWWAIKKVAPGLLEHWWMGFVLGAAMLAAGIGFLLYTVQNMGKWIERWRA